MNWVWLTAWILCFVASVVAHEVGHVVIGKYHGWELAGFKFLPPKVKMGHRSPNMKDWSLGQVALAGPLATLAMTCVFIGLSLLPIEHAWIFGSLAALNFAIFIFNLLPLPITDGGHILFAITGWRLRWRYVGAVWVAAEIAATIVALEVYY